MTMIGEWQSIIHLPANAPDGLYWDPLSDWLHVIVGGVDFSRRVFSDFDLEGARNIASHGGLDLYALRTDWRRTLPHRWEMR